MNNRSLLAFHINPNQMSLVRPKCIILKYGEGSRIKLKNWSSKIDKKTLYNLKRNKRLASENSLEFCMHTKPLQAENIHKLSKELVEFDSKLQNRVKSTRNPILKKLINLKKFKYKATQSLAEELIGKVESLTLFQLKSKKSYNELASGLIINSTGINYLYYLNVDLKEKVDPRISITQLCLYELACILESQGYEYLDLLVGDSKYKRVFKPQPYSIYMKASWLLRQPIKQPVNFSICLCYAIKNLNCFWLL